MIEMFSLKANFASEMTIFVFLETANMSFKILEHIGCLSHEESSAQSICN
jgi:hypothetical protein